MNEPQVAAAKSPAVNANTLAVNANTLAVNANTLAVDATTLTFMIWMMYKLNIITRHQVKDFMDIIKAGKWPEDVVKYLNDETAKLF